MGVFNFFRKKSKPVEDILDMPPIPPPIDERDDKALSGIGGEIPPPPADEMNPDFPNIQKEQSHEQEPLEMAGLNPDISYMHEGFQDNESVNKPDSDTETPLYGEHEYNLPQMPEFHNEHPETDYSVPPSTPPTNINRVVNNYGKVISPSHTESMEFGEITHEFHEQPELENETTVSIAPAQKSSRIMPRVQESAIPQEFRINERVARKFVMTPSAASSIRMDRCYLRVEQYKSIYDEMNMSKADADLCEQKISTELPKENDAEQKLHIRLKSNLEDIQKRLIAIDSILSK